MKSKASSRAARRRNTTGGVSITELLVASILLGVSLAAVAEVMSMCVLANTKLTKQVDTSSSMRVAIDRLKRDIRMASEIVSSTTEFPGEFSNSQTLIMHVPIFYLDKKNDPASSDYVSSAPQNGLNGVPIPGYYAVMYKVIPDPDPAVQNQFLMQVTRKLSATALPLDASCSYTSEIFPAQTVAHGIIGPTAPGSPPGSVPIVFSYLCRYNNGVSTLTSTASTISRALAGSAGVGIDLEIKQYNSSVSPTESAFDDVRAAHAEAFLRLPKTELGSTDSTYYEVN